MRRSPQPSPPARSTSGPRSSTAGSAARLYIERWSLMPSGGHFPGPEEPDLLVAELGEFFRTAR